MLLDPIETGGWTGVATSNGANKAYNYGKFLGLRYRNYANILWISGNDFQSWRNGTDDAAIRAVGRVITSPDADIVEDRTATGAGSYAATAPVNDTWVMQLAAFR